jgi:hypothetical protein
MEHDGIEAREEIGPSKTPRDAHMTRTTEKDNDPRLAVLRDLVYDSSDRWRIATLEKLDAVDPLRQPVAMDAVEAALDAQWTSLHGSRGNVPHMPKEIEAMTRALAAANAAKGRDTEANAPPPSWTAAKERVLRQLAFLQPRAPATDAERKLWSEIRRAAFPEKSDE